MGDEGVPFRQIAEAIGVGLGLPVTAVAAEDADAHFGYLAPFVGLDNPTSNERTKALLGWKPEHLGLIDDIERGGYLPPATPEATRVVPRWWPARR